MKKLLGLFTLLLALASLKAQPTITKDDMPAPGDTIWFNTTNFAPGLDYAPTGNNFTWDFSSLSGTQEADTFISLSSTSFTLQLAYGLGANPANLAQISADFPAIPGIPITGITNFFRNSTNSFMFLGYGLDLSGIGIPLKFNSGEVLYKFPLTINSPKDSSTAILSQSLMTLGYLGINKKRVNQVDGWGTLITPYGTFQTLRVKSVVHEEDSIYLDTLNMGIPIVRDYIEYKWLGTNHGAPLLTVTVESPLTTWRWIANPSATGLPEDVLANDLVVFPNPSSGQFHLRFFSKDVKTVRISLLSLNGQELYDLSDYVASPGNNMLDFDISHHNLSPGVYFIRILDEKQVLMRKLLIGQF